MDLNEVILRILAAASGSVLLVLAWYMVRSDTRKPSGTGVIDYGIAVKLIGIIGAAVFLAAGYLTYMFTGFKDRFSLAIFITLMAMCLALVIETVVVRVRYSERGIFTTSPWRPAREIPWHSITGYKWSEINKWHILKTRSHGWIRLSMYLRGLPPFFQVLKERNPALFETGEVTLDEINMRSW
jgi:hypothetical protein